MAELVVTPDDNTKNGATERVESAAASAETNEQRVELGGQVAERHPAGQHLEEHHTHRPQVGPVVERLPAQLLG